MYNIRVNPNINYGLWVILLCPLRPLILTNVVGILIEGDVVQVWERNFIGILVLSAQLCYETNCSKKSSLKHTHQITNPNRKYTSKTKTYILNNETKIAV